MRQFRNRIAHHDYARDYDLPMLMSRVRELAELISPTFGTWLDENYQEIWMNQWQERPATKQDTMVVPDSRGSWETYKRKSAGSVIGCKQFSCSGDAVRRLIMGCRRMLSVEDRAAIMAGLEAGLSQTRIAHLIGRSPSVVCREIARHRGPGGVYQAEDAGRAAQVARRRPKKRLLDRDEILRRRVIFDLSQGRTPRQISGRLSVEACGTVAPMDNSPHAQGRTISHEAIYTWIYAHPKKTLIEHGVCLPSRRWMRKKPPAGGRTPPIVGMRLIDERPDIADRMIPGNWEGDLIIGKDGASACATLVERTTRYLIIVALPLGRRADQVCDALTRRIQGLPEGAMRTLTWDQGREMARHQRLTQDTGVEVFFAHPHSPWERGTNENTNRLIRRYLPKGTPITSTSPTSTPSPTN